MIKNPSSLKGFTLYDVIIMIKTYNVHNLSLMITQKWDLQEERKVL